MFPNVRLMIVAMFASVVALSCGFGVFAAFRINHEPLARLPAAATSLRFAARTVELPPAVVIAAVDSVDRHPVSIESGADSVVADSHALKIDPGQAGQPPAVAAVAPQAGIAEPQSHAHEPESQATVVEETVVLAVQPLAPLVEPPPASAPPALVDAPSPAVLDRVADAAATGDGSAAAPMRLASEETTAAETVREEKLGEEAAAGVEFAKPTVADTPPAAPTPAPVLAAVEAPETLAPPAEEAKEESEPLPSAVSYHDGKRRHVVRRLWARRGIRMRFGWRHHRQRPRVLAYSASQNYAPSEPHFQSAPPSFQSRPTHARWSRSRHVRFASRRSGRANSAVGGPYVSPRGY